jgi:hypothetical protein
MFWPWPYALPPHQAIRHCKELQNQATEVMTRGYRQGFSLARGVALAYAIVWKATVTRATRQRNVFQTYKEIVLVRHVECLCSTHSTLGHGRVVT